MSRKEGQKSNMEELTTLISDLPESAIEAIIDELLS